MRDTWVRLEPDPGKCDNGPEFLGCQGPKPYRNHEVQLPLALKEEKGITEYEMAGWHHRLNGHGFG